MDISTSTLCHSMYLHVGYCKDKPFSSICYICGYHQSTYDIIHTYCSLQTVQFVRITHMTSLDHTAVRQSFCTCSALLFRASPWGNLCVCLFTWVWVHLVEQHATFTITAAWVMVHPQPSLKAHTCSICQGVIENALPAQITQQVMHLSSLMIDLHSDYQRCSLIST